MCDHSADGTAPARFLQRIRFSLKLACRQTILSVRNGAYGALRWFADRPIQVDTTLTTSRPERLVFAT
jgi:hypothetical protein